MRKAHEAPMAWVLRVMPLIIFAMGCIADLVLNVAVTDPQAQRFLPEICGLTVGMLTVLTFAMRRQAYLAAGVVFMVVEMAAVALAMPFGIRLGTCAASLAVAAACLVIYTRGPWAPPRPVYAQDEVTSGE
jgi:hypothetical protein